MSGPETASNDARPAQPEAKLAYSTDLGRMYLSDDESFLDSAEAKALKGKVNLIFTSPPFPLNRKKKYGNLTGDEYLKWLRDLAPRLVELLRPKGSFVMELGNAWEPGKPVMSTLALRAMLEVLEAGDLNLCQQFICHNPARLPSPAQWVNVERIRVKDSFTHVWWMAPDERPKADNRRVLREYSASMKALLNRQSYNSGRRPSGHVIGETSFLTDHKGAIPPNVLECVDFSELQIEIPTNFMEMSNTHSGDAYRAYCKEHDLEAHPAPMQPGLVEFFVKFLTTKNDLVYDPFGGSNMTGAVAEQLGRRWLATEPTPDYVNGSRARFEVTSDPQAS